MSKANQMGRDIMSNNKNFNDEVLKINRQLKKDNDNLKAEIKSLWSDLSKLEKQLANYKSEPKEDNQETEYVWFATDGQGNNMGTFVLESSARDFAMKYGYTVGWWIKDKECDD